MGKPNHYIPILNKPESIFEKYITAWSTNQPNLLKGLLDANAKIVDIPLSIEYEGNEILNYIDKTFATYKDYVFSTKVKTNNFSETMAFSFCWVLQHKQHSRRKLQGVDVIYVENNKIILIESFYDINSKYEIMFPNLNLSLFDANTSFKANGEPQNSVTKITRTICNKPEPSNESPTKYKNSGLSDEDQNELANKLKELMTLNKVFLDSELKCQELANLCNVSNNHISQTINNVWKVNFNNFVNSYRVKYSLELLTQNNNKSILDIAMDSGFNSSSSFYNIFKSFTGKTPKFYKRLAAN